MEHSRVRCANCGYLGMRRFSDGAWMEANNIVREERRTVSYKHTRPIPECCKKAFNLPEEARELVRQRLKSQNIPREMVTLQQPTPGGLLSVIDRERTCNSYKYWVPRQTPPDTESQPEAHLDEPQECDPGT